MTRILAVATAALLLITPASPVSAASADTVLDAAKKVTTARIDGRLATLKAEGLAVRAAVHRRRQRR